MLVTDGGSRVAQCTVKVYVCFEGVWIPEYSPAVPANVAFFTYKTQTNKNEKYIKYIMFKLEVTTIKLK